MPLQSGQRGKVTRMMTSNGNSNRILRRVLAATALVAVGFICTARAADRDPRDSAPPDAIPEAVKKAIAFDKIGKKADKPYRIAYLTECVTNTYCEARIVCVPYEQAYGEGFEDMPRRVPDITRIGALVGYRPTKSLDQILQRVVDYFRDAP